jgi:hypothetical protein
MLLLGFAGLFAGLAGGGFANILNAEVDDAEDDGASAVVRVVLTSYESKKSSIDCFTCCFIVCDVVVGGGILAPLIPKPVLVAP